MEVAQPTTARSREAIDIATYRREADAPADVGVLAEQTVLGARMLGTCDVPDTCKVRPTEFSTPVHVTIALAIEACERTGNAVDPLTVLDELTRGGHAAGCGGVAYLHDLVRSLPSAPAIASHAGIVRAKARERANALIRSQIAAAAKGGCPAEEFRDRVVGLLGELNPQESPAATRFQ